MAQKFASDYVDVAARIVEFREKYPDGCLRPADPTQPYRVETVDGRTFIVVVAAAYRSPTDPMPGVGMAWEQFPGATNFTRNSELQNAETSAWGRAIVAVLAADTRKGISSAEDVRNRQAEQRDQPAPRRVPADVLAAKHQVWQAWQQVGGTSRDELAEAYAQQSGGLLIGDAGPDELFRFADHLRSLIDPGEGADDGAAADAALDDHLSSVGGAG